MTVRPANSNCLCTNLIKSKLAQENTTKKVNDSKANKSSGITSEIATFKLAESQTRSLADQIRSHQNQISQLQVAENAMISVNDVLQQINDLALQSLNEEFTTADHQTTQSEIDQFKAHMDEITSSASFDGKKLLDGSFKFESQNGEIANISVDAQSLGLSNIDITTKEGANLTISGSQQTMKVLNSHRDSINDKIDSLTNQVSSFQTELSSTVPAQHRIQNIDMATELININLSEFSSEISIEAFKMRDENRATVLSLIKD